MSQPQETQRIDKWLWAARFYKTRALASEQIKLGRVRIGGANVKPARTIRPGETIWLRRGHVELEVVVQALSATRGPAPVAQTLYTETEESKTKRERAAAMRRLAPEPARFSGKGRPNKHERRALEQQQRAALDDRWSAALDDWPAEPRADDQ